MDTPVFKLYLAKVSLDGTLLSERRNAELIRKLPQILRGSGGHNLVTGTIWSDERYRSFGIQMFPSWQAVRAHDRQLDELNWFQYIQSRMYLGVEREDMPNNLLPRRLDPAVDWIVLLSLVRRTPEGYAMSREERAKFAEIEEQARALGAKELLHIETQPSNEECDRWTVTLFPSLEVLIARSRMLEQACWGRYFTIQSFLGSPMGGELIYH
jgi:hypothetical protein